MVEHICRNCGKKYESGDEVCRYCGFILPFSTSVLTPGKLLRQRYEIQGLAHSGGMGYVYLAKDKNLYDRICVVKQVKEPVKSDTDRKRLEEEALRMSKLSHSNAAMILDQFVEGGYYFLVVQHISGKTLGQVLEDRRGPLAEDEVVNWAISMCDVVSYLHGKGVIHRDISPENIMLTDEGSIMFIDFGTMRELRQITSEKTAGIGKFGFTPPEQWQGRPVAQSDTFAIGATVYYLLTEYLPLSAEYQRGQKPQPADFRPSFPPIREKNPNVSGELEAVLQEALQLDVSQRYSSAQELGRALRNICKAEVTAAPPLRVSPVPDDSAAVTLVQRGKAVANRGWFRSGIALLVIGLLAIGLAMAIAASTSEDRVLVAVVLTVVLILPFVIPGVICLRRGIAQGLPTIPVRGAVANWWWSLPAALGFVGGIVSWVKQKDVDRRKAMNMLTWGIIVTIAWPTLTSAIPFLWLEPTAPPVLHVDRQSIDFSDLKPDSGMVYESLTVTNIGGGTLVGKVTAGEAWLEASPAEIQVTGHGQEIKVVVDTTGLSHGKTYRGLINIDNTETHGADEWIEVTLTTTAEPTATTTTSDVIFEDDFSDPNSGWHGGYGEWSYESGEYRVVVTDDEYLVQWAENARIGQLGDFVLEVDARVASGPSLVGYGIVFRDQGLGNYYGLILFHNGYYYINKWVEGTVSTLKEATYSSAYIHKGTSTNRLKIVCKGHDIEVYANDNRLCIITDDSFSEGGINLAAQKSPGENAYVYFDKLKISAVD